MPLRFAIGIFLEVSLSSPRARAQSGSVDPPPVGFAVQIRLRSRLTLRGRTFLRNPLTFGAPDLPRRFRYSSRHSRFYVGLPKEEAIERSPTVLTLVPVTSAGRLIPVIFGARLLKQ